MNGYKDQSSILGRILELADTCNSRVEREGRDRDASSLQAGASVAIDVPQIRETLWGEGTEGKQIKCAQMQSFTTKEESILEPMQHFGC